MNRTETMLSLETALADGRLISKRQLESLYEAMNEGGILMQGVSLSAMYYPNLHSFLSNPSYQTKYPNLHSNVKQLKDGGYL